MVKLSQLIWCNSYIGSTRKIWNSKMSFFVLGLKSDVFFFNINYTQFLLNKTKSILKNFLKKKKNVIFVIPTTVLQISKIRKTIKTRKYLHQNISTLEIITIANWEFGLLTNFKRVNKNNKVIPIKILPAALFVFINKITESSDYLNILKEASILNILSIGLVDTDQDPYAFHYPIPGNTKSFESICFYYRFFLSYLYLCSLKTKSVFFKNLIFSYNKIYATLK